jgi:hypothetical protein
MGGATGFYALPGTPPHGFHCPAPLDDCQLTTVNYQLSTAKICREKGIEYARRLLGHSDISTTQWYMHLDDRELADAQDLVE